MADYEVERAKTAQLAANSVDAVTLTGYFEVVEILNLSGTAEIYVRVDGDVDPTVAGDDCNVLPAGIGSVTLPTTPDADSVVRLISSGTPRYHVRGVAKPEI